MPTVPPMSAYLRTILALGCLVGSLAFAQRGSAGEEPETREGYLLLTNGEVVAGKVTHAGDFYHVALPKGELRLKAREVDLWADRLADLYLAQRERLSDGNSDDHLSLADWCLKNGLIESAREELADVRKLDPEHPRVAMLARRLDLADQPPAEKRAKSVATAEGITNKDLDRFIRGLPRGTVESFTNTIQPLLLNYCSAAGCHGPKSENGLKLARASLAGKGSRRITQRNLHSAWRFVDRDSPAQSKLLTLPVRPHGSAKTPIFSEKQAAKYRQLVAWSRLVAGNRPHSDEKDRDVELARPQAESRESDVRQASFDSPLAREEAEDSATTKEKGEKEPAGKDSSSEDSGDSSPDESDEDSPREERPKDSFDPEIFNRRYRR